MNALGWVGVFAGLVGSAIALAHEDIDAANSRALAKWHAIENERQTGGGEYSRYILGIGLALVMAGIVMVIVSLGQA